MSKQPLVELILKAGAVSRPTFHLSLSRFNETRCPAGRTTDAVDFTRFATTFARAWHSASHLRFPLKTIRSDAVGHVRRTGSAPTTFQAVPTS